MELVAVLGRVRAVGAHGIAHVLCDGGYLSVCTVCPHYQGRVMYDAFIYQGNNGDVENERYLIDCDASLMPQVRSAAAVVQTLHMVTATAQERVRQETPCCVLFVSQHMISPAIPVVHVWHGTSSMYISSKPCQVVAPSIVPCCNRCAP